jgi:hypothetical protein
VIFEGDFDQDVVGYSASWAGDLNGDGVTDLAIGAPGAGPAGSAYVVYGVRAVPEPQSAFLCVAAFIVLARRFPPRRTLFFEIRSKTRVASGSLAGAIYSQGQRRGAELFASYRPDWTSLMNQCEH